MSQRNVDEAIFCFPGRFLDQDTAVRFLPARPPLSMSARTGWEFLGLESGVSGPSCGEFWASIYEEIASRSWQGQGRSGFYVPALESARRTLPSKAYIVVGSPSKRCKVFGG